MRLVAAINGTEVIEPSSGVVFWWVGMNIDGDGSGGNKEKDPCFQPKTTLEHADGSSLNSRTECFGVVPPQVIKGVAGVVMGCQGFAINTANGKSSPFVVGDIGPSDKIGEGSIALAEALGVAPSPINGGDDIPEISWRIFPGRPAEVNGVKYNLQPA